MIPLDTGGPSDPYHDHPFRVKVGAASHYHDPLPTCDIADATDATWPAVSTIKNASASDWTAVAIKRIAPVIVANPDHFADMDVDAVKAEMRHIDKASLTRAAMRGTNVHLMAEEHLTGQGVMIADDAPGAEYRATVDAFFEHHQPEPVLTEFVCINRGLNEHGYGGTADGIIRIDGKTYLVDWKSRGDDSKHGAYPQEAAQLGAYAGADYIIVGNQRRKLPALDGGLIVSIKPDGFAVYPIDLDHAGRHWRDLHAWWSARKDERKAIGRMWPKPKAPKIAPPVSSPSTVEAPAGGDETHSSETSPPATLDELRAEVMTWSEIDRTNLSVYFRTHNVDNTDAAQVAAAMTHIKGLHDVHTDTPTRPVLPPKPPTLPTVTDEGDTLSTADVEAAGKRYAALPADVRSWVTATGARVRLSPDHGGRPTVRRFELLRGLCALAESGFDNDDMLRAVAHHILGDIVWQGAPAAAVVAALDLDEARRFARMCDALAGAADVSLRYTTDGRAVLEPSVLSAA